MSFDDEFIRSRIMSGHEHTPADPHAALASLKPAMRQARRRRHAALGAMTAALVGAGALGIVALSSATGSTDLRNSTRGEVLPTPDTNNDALPTSTVQLPETTSTTPPPDDDSLIISATTPERVAVPSSDVTSPPTSAELTVESTTPNQPATPSSTRPRPAPTTPPNTIVTPATTTTSAPSATTVPTTTPSTTTAPPTASGQRTISSSCGSVTIEYSGENVTLLSTQPNSGFAVDIKKAGPAEVEVGFDLDDAECEIKVRMDSGELDISVDNPDD